MNVSDGYCEREVYMLHYAEIFKSQPVPTPYPTLPPSPSPYRAARQVWAFKFEQLARSMHAWMDRYVDWYGWVDR